MTDCTMYNTYPRASRLLLACFILSAWMIGSASGHNLDTRATSIHIADDFVGTMAARAGLNQPLIQVGDEFWVVIKTTPGPGTFTGVGGYQTFYVLPGYQVLDAAYVFPVSTGTDPRGFIEIPIKGQSPIAIGAGPNGQKLGTGLTGFTYPAPNILGVNEAPVTSNGLARGTLAGVYADTGIFYSTNPLTIFNSYTGAPMVNNSGDLVGEQVSPIGGLGVTTLWDIYQLRAFGRKDVAPIIDTVDGRGNAPWGMASAVAGPESGYAWSFNYDLYTNFGGTVAAITNAIEVGPWKRIQYPGSQVSFDQAGLVSTVLGYAGVNGAHLGYDLKNGAPLERFTDGSGVNAIRFAIGQLELGRPEWSAVKLKIVDPLAPDCRIMYGDAFGGDAGGTDTGKDHLWRYFDPTVVSLQPCVVLQKKASKPLVAPNEIFYYTLTFANAGGVTLSNVTLTDTLPAGIQFVSAIPAPSTSSPPNYVWNLGTVPSNTVVVITNWVKATGLGSLLNTAVVRSGTNVVASAVETVEVSTRAILREEKTVSTANAGPGDIINYTITISNVGTGPNATPLSVTDLLPTGITYSAFVSATINGASITPTITATNPSRPVFTVNQSIQPSNALVIVFSALISSNAPPGSYCNGIETSFEGKKLGPISEACLTVGGGQIGDTIFRDWNGNGVQDSGEEGMPGVTVRLYDSTGTNLLASTVTSSNGLYFFSGLSGGTYVVAVSGPGTNGVPSAYVLSADPDGGPLNLAYTYALATNEVFLGADFGFRPGGAGSIGDQIFEDVGNNGSFDSGADPGISNVTVYLYEDSNGNGVINTGVDALVSTTLTGPTGLYAFTNLATGFSYLVYVAPADTALSNYFNGLYGPGAPFTASTPNPHSVTNLVGAYTAADIGFWHVSPGSIGDQVFIDLDADGVYDLGSDTPLAGVTVTLFLDGNPIATTSSGPDGSYLFGNLGPGNYSVVVDTTSTNIPSGHFASVPSYNVALSAGQNYLAADFPFVAGLTKTSEKTFALPGQTNTYSLKPFFPGAELLTAVRVFDPIPTGTTYVAGSANAGGTFGGYVSIPGVTGADVGLTNTILLSRNFVNVGGSVIVTMNVRTATAATNVSPIDFDVTGGPYTILSGPTPATQNVSTAAGGSNFVWTIRLDGAGEYIVHSAAEDAAESLTWPLASSPSILSVPYGGTNVVTWNLGTNQPGTVGEIITSGFTPGFYALRGNTTTNFSKFSTDGSFWSQRAGAPATIAAGGALASSGTGTLYALRGSKTQTFYVHNVQSNTWAALANTGANVDKGGALVFLASNTVPHVYAFMGNGTGFRRYNVTNNTWTALAATPANVKEGGSLTTDGTNIFATFGNSGAGDRQRFYRYNRNSNTWTQLANFPVNAGWGTAITRLGGFIYALGGNNGSTFHRYNIAANTWTNLANTPAAVWQGGAIATDGVDIFALRGNTTADFWRYNVSNNTWTALSSVDFGTVNVGGSLAFHAGSNAQGRVTQLAAYPTLVSTGDVVTVVMRLTSSTTVSNVVPSNLTVAATGGATATLLTGPVPPSNNVLSNVVTEFTWTYRANPGTNAGSLTFSGTARGNAGATAFPTSAANSVLVSPILTFRVTVNSGAPPVIVNQGLMAEQGGEMDPILSNPTQLSTAGSIGDRVWEDLDGDGVQDTNEVGLSGVEVCVFQSNGVTLVSCAVTDLSGNYRIYGLTGATYVVRTSPGTFPSGYTPTTLSELTVVLTNNQQYNDADFGLQPPGTGIIGDTVWLDADANGVFDAGEQGLAGVSLLLEKLIAAVWTPIGTTSTDTNGQYFFTGLTLGDYRVTVNTNSSIASPYGGTNALGSVTTPTYDLDGTNTPHVALVTLATSTSVVDTVDFGYNWNGRIGDFVWYDTNGNGLQDETDYFGGPRPAPGGTAVLYVDVSGNGEVDPEDFIIAVQETCDGSPSYPCSSGQAPGAYLFTNLPPGSYIVAVSEQEIPSPVSSNIGVMVHTRGEHQAVTLGTGSGQSMTELDLDFGLIEAAIIEGHVFYDVNHNGVLDGGEPRFTNIAVVLTGTDIFTNTVTITNFTDASGEYKFIVPPGTYTITYSIPNVLAQNPSVTDATTPTSILLSVAAGAEYVGNDFGRDDAGRIGDTIFADLDGTSGAGVGPGAGDVGLAGVTVNLYLDTNGDNIGDILLDVQLTGATGFYEFIGLADTTGTQKYVVQVVTSTIPVIYQTTPSSYPVGAIGSTYATVLTNGQTIAIVDFGYPVVPTLVFYTVSGTVFYDANTNGVLDGESGISNVTLNIAVDVDNDGTNDLFYSVPSGTNGAYSIAGIPSNSTVTITVDGGTLPSSAYVGTTTNQLVVPNISGNATDQDFGFVEVFGSISGAVVANANGNGIAEFGEVPLGDVAVILTYGGPDNIIGTGDDVVYTNYTDAAGQYIFTNLPPGVYEITKITPAGFVDLADADGGNPNLITLALPLGADVTQQDFEVDAVPGFMLFKDISSPAGRPAAVGETVTFVITLSNTGSHTLAVVDLNDTFDPAYLAFVSADPAESTSGAGFVTWSNLGPVLVGNSLSVTASFTAVQSTLPGDTTNTVVASAMTTNGIPLGPLTSSVPAVLASPAHLIEKLLIDPASGVAGIGDNIIFTLTVTNTGDVVLDVVRLDDTFDTNVLSFAGATPAADTVGAGIVTWSNVGPLAVGGSVVVTANFTAVASTMPGQTTNVVTSSPETTNGVPVAPQVDDEPVAVADPAITVIKTAGAAADGAVWYVTNGTDVIYTYLVVNSGDTYLSDITVTDSVLGVVGTITGPVAPGETNILFATNLNVTVDVTNVADVSGTPTDHLGNPLGLPDVTDTDDAFVDVVAPALTVIKTAGTAADGDAFYINSGADVVYTYVVINSGDTYLTDIAVDDDVLGPIGAIPGPVAPGATNILYATNLNVTAAVTNIADVTGTPADQNGNSLGLNDVSAADDADVDLLGSIGDFVWHDLDADGIQDGGETGVASVVVHLYDAATNLIASTTTDVNGAYAFLNVIPGSYFVEFDPASLPAGFVFSPAGQGGNPALDSDANPGDGRTALFSVLSGEQADAIDAGIHTTAVIGDFVWYDYNKNGIQDGGSETGVAGVVVFLYDAATNVVGTTTTDVAGAYTFIGVSPGVYFVGFDTNSFPAGFVLTLQTQGSNTLVDSDPDSTTGLTAFFAVISGQTESSIDAGLACSGIDLSCPADVTLECIADTSTNVTGVATATSPCDCPLTVNYTDSTQSMCGVTFVLSREWTATDDCGNSATCTQTITVVDTTPPAITCPADVTVECLADVPAADTNAVSASDNCSVPGVTHVGDTAQTNGCVITITRTYRATDECGNSTDCDQTITVEDTTPPAITCPADVTVECLADVPAVDTNAVSASDNCSVPGVTHVGDTAQTNGCIITITRTYRATDECGNSTDCDQTITVEDTTPPAITCPADVTVECLADVPAVDTNAVSASDNCSVPGVTHVGDTAQTNGCVITITRTYRATDECGNSTDCDQTITVEDTTPPAITCPADVTVECLADVPAVDTNAVSAGDNCSVPGVTHVGDTAQTNGCVITITRTYRATDECGNSTDCDQTITVEDTTPPAITCPADVTVECLADVPAVDTNAVSASDNCTASPARTHVGDTAQTNGCVITITRTYRATDECGNSTDCDQTITVEDTTPPAITCPQDVTVECIGDVPAADTNAVSASDNCSVPGVTHVGDTAQTNGCVITITRTYRATDECGNSTDCDQTITVEDTTPPAITCPADVTVECLADVPAADTNAVSASDNCSVPGVTHVGDTAQTNGCIITITRTYRATDECGNSTDCDQTITVEDTTPPAITCPADVTVECLADVPAADTNAVSASDNCSVPGVTHVGDTAQTNGCIITITRTYRATDECGNSTDCDQTITVEDTTPPAITCPADVTVECLADVPAVDTNAVSAGDNCSVPGVTHVGDTAQTNGCVITITRTYRATDECGNSTDCDQTITVEDTTPPAITCPADVTVECLADVPAVDTNAVSASDNCSVPGVTHVGDTAQTNGCIITITRTYRATDECGNSTDCDQTITVEDTTPPAITCPQDVTVECIGDVPAADTNAVSASDNCSVPGVTHVGDTAQTNGCIITITRTYRATDECGNSTDCDQTITVEDTTPPAITCPQDVTVECIGDVPAADTNAVSASDNCSVPGVTHVGDTAQTNGCVITITRTYRATDECGNSTDCDQTITVEDTTPPAITCPADVTVECLADVPAVDTNAVSASDNCSVPGVTHVGDTAQTNGCIITITRTYRATDECGNSTDCDQTITVEDTTPPAITCPQDVTVECIGDVPAADTNAVSASDNCSVPGVTHVGDTAQTNGCIITITRTYRATDECGNSTDCDQTITVEDTTPPAITCPQDVTVECIGDVPAADTNAVSASDNCSVPGVTHVGDTAQTNGCVITITRTYRATDECGNSTDCDQTITVEDTTPPAITCPADVTVECLADVPAADTNAVSASDNCSVPGVTHVGDTAQTNGCIITITRTYRATDECGNSTDCDQTITVEDTTPPAITCPQDVTVECIGDVPAADTNAVSASDNCSVPGVTHVGDTAQTNGCIITITRTYRATDECGNSTDCDQTITVEDTTPPAITCPADVTVECLADVPAVDTNAVSASDNCSVPGVTHVGDTAQTNGCIITITRTYRATDECGNSTDCDQTITVEDTTPPAITCPADVTVECLADVPAVDTNAVSASDNCSVPGVTHVGDTAQTNGCIITITRTYRATDECGNSTDCDQTITVEDTTPPAITCPADVTVECLADVPAVDTNAVSASDNCSVPGVTHVGDTAQTNGCVITITRTYRATDECGNSTDCDQTITVEDTTPPAITCPADVTVECLADVPAVDTNAVSASDNCSVPGVTHVGDTAQTNGCIITITRTYRATDECGNSTDCDQTITVEDTTPPAITCPADVTVECLADVPAVDTNAVSASDNCSVPGVTHVGDTAQTNGCIITITRTYRATDECGNSTDCDQTITVEDTTPPAITCPADVTVECLADVPAVDTNAVSASDNCSVPGVTHVGDTAQTNGCIITITRTYRATDECGNSTDCDQTITVEDTTPPAITCPQDVTVECIGDVPAADTNAVSASDNCSVPGVTHVGDTAQTNGCVITITRTYRATDECGNSTDCDQTITVEDTTPPAITCPADVTVECLADVPAADTNAVSASDNCSVPGVTHVGDTAQTNGCIITITRTYRATDECGNSTDCDQTITVEDTTPPAITCPADVTVECLADVPAVDTNAVSAGDNCSVPGVTHVGDTAQTNGCVITITRTYRATDECGNSTDCDQTITVEDTTPPAITCPADVTVECLADVPAVDTNAVSASDNCSVPGVTHVGDTAQTNGCIITITRTYRATDECGNSTDCDQTITVEDTTPPAITCPADVTVECLADVPAVDTNAVSASDNCSVPGVTHVGDTAQTNGCVITITRTYRATDACGNSTTCTQTITVSDTIPPQITCPAPVTVQCIADVPAPNTNAVSASDNCTVSPVKTHVGDSAVTNGCVITITRTYRATDACGNSTDCDQTITVQDTIPPSITCPASVTVQCISDVPAPNTGLVSASDNCTVNPAKTHVGDSAVTNGCVITITRTYRATDACGNSTTCTQTITVSDTIPPQITCPAPVTVQCIADVPAPNTNAVSASDNCTASPAKTHVGDSAVTNGCVITITRTYRATDACGNSTTCTQTITVSDTIPPQITCPAPVTVQCIADVPAPNTNAVSASDNCTASPARAHVGDSAVTNGCVITITRTYRATDACGNSTTCTQTITVSDTIPPQITCPAPVTVQCIADVPAPNTNAVSASDNCTASPARTHVGDSAVTNGCVITITRTYRATDACGNSTTCTQTITVSDTIPPQITCPAPVTVQCIADVPAPNTNAVSASDNCTASPSRAHVGDTAQTNGCIITITRTYRATDACGNSTTCTQTITVSDTIPPSITCPASVTVQCISDVPAPNTGLVSASDNCTVNPAKTHVGDSAVTNGCVITITRTYRATDACGNSTTCTQTITVSDTIPPQIISCPPSVVQVQGNANCQAQVPSLTGQVLATDNCDTSLAITQVPPAGTMFTVSTSVTIIVTDDCGNTNASCFVTVQTPCNPGFAVQKTLLSTYLEPGTTNARPPVVGESLQFAITVLNTGAVNLVTIPVEDRYETAYLMFTGAAPPTVDNANDGMLNWSNVGPLSPGASTSLLVGFVVVGETGGGVRTNLAVVSPTTPPLTPPVDPKTNGAPYQANLPASIGGLVWEDVNYNSLYDGESPTPAVTGLVVNLYLTNGVLVTNTLTDGVGAYQFTNLVPAAYIVGFTIPTSHVFVTQNEGVDDTVDSDPSRITGLTGPIHVLPGQSDQTVYAGIVSFGVIGDHVWWDHNENAAQDENLATFGVNGATVRLFRISGGATSLVATAVTQTETNGSKGFYVFTNLQFGLYLVQVDTNSLPNHLKKRTTVAEYIVQLKPDFIYYEADFGFSTIPTAIALREFRASREGPDRVRLIWETAVELENLGFHLYRAASVAGPKTRITDSLIAGEGTSSGRAYDFVDTDADEGATWYYWLEDIDWHLASTLHGPIVAPAATASSESALVGTFSVETRKADIYRITWDAMAAAGISAGLLSDQVKVVIEGEEVATYVHARGQVMQPGDYVLFYLPPGSEGGHCEVRSGPNALRMAEIYAAPQDDGGSVWYAVKSEDGALRFETKPECTRYLLAGFRDNAVLVLDITQELQPMLLFGYAWLSLPTDTALYLGYTPAEPARCIAVEAGAIQDVENLRRP